MSHELRIRMSATEDQERLEDEDFEGEGDWPHGDRKPDSDDEIPRGETGLRIALTLLFALIGSVLETVLAAIVVFELVATLITRRPPSPRVRELANRIISYYYELGRYLTYNQSRVPFPFSDFPEALEPDAFDLEDRESKALGVRLRERNEGDASHRDDTPTE
jgi:hypothetical protein